MSPGQETFGFKKKKKKQLKSEDMLLQKCFTKFCQGSESRLGYELSHLISLIIHFLQARLICRSLKHQIHRMPKLQSLQLSPGLLPVAEVPSRKNRDREEGQAYLRVLGKLFSTS